MTVGENVVHDGNGVGESFARACRGDGDDVTVVGKEVRDGTALDGGGGCDVHAGESGLEGGVLDKRGKRMLHRGRRRGCMGVLWCVVAEIVIVEKVEFAR